MMGFIFDGLDAEEYDRNYSDNILVKRILNYFRPQARKMLIAAGMIAGAALLEAGVPIFISRSIDTLRADTAAGQIALIALALIGLSAFSWVFNLIRQTLSSQAVGDVVLKMREDACDSVLRRDMSFYDQFPSGKIVSRVTSDSATFSQVMNLSMELLSRLLLVLVLVGYLATVSLN
jgi:ATP-binding cassette subfamily B protein